MNYAGWTHRGYNAGDRPSHGGYAGNALNNAAMVWIPLTDGDSDGQRLTDPFDEQALAALNSAPATAGNIRTTINILHANQVQQGDWFM